MVVIVDLVAVHVTSAARCAQFIDLLNTVMYHADGRKIDWKAIHKIERYINVRV